jgi:hypothetical protein
MRRGGYASRVQTIHLEKRINTPVEEVFSAFQSTRLLNRWYDPEAALNRFKVGGEVKADYFPGYLLVAIVKNQLIAQQYTSVIDGIGLWSLVAEGAVTHLSFDHIAEGNKGREMTARTFHWQGLIENLSALLEGRPIPFVDGEYRKGAFPRGIQYATCEEYVRSVKAAKP